MAEQVMKPEPLYAVVEFPKGNGFTNTSQVANNTNSGSSNKVEHKKKRAKTVKATLDASKKDDNTGNEHANENLASENASTVATNNVDKSMPDDNIEQDLDDVPSLKQKEVTHSALNLDDTHNDIAAVNESVTLNTLDKMDLGIEPAAADIVQDDSAAGALSMFIVKDDIQNLLQCIIEHFDKKSSELLQGLTQKIGDLESQVKSLDAKLINIQKDVDELKVWTVNKRRFAADEYIMSLALDAKLINIQKDVDELKVWTVNKRRFAADEYIMPLATLAEKHNLNLPLQLLQDFDDLNLKLTLESELYKDVKAHIICTINTENKDFMDEITKLLKKFLSRDILTSHTAQRLSHTKKRIFKSTNFYICLKDSLMHTYATKIVIEDGKLCGTIGHIINNAYDWEGHRQKRLRPNN